MNTLGRNNLLCIYVLFIIATATYFSALNDDFVNWKDEELIQQLYAGTQNSTLTSEQNEYSPIQYQLFQFEYRVGGQGQFLYRAVSVLLHAANAILFFLLISALLRSRFLAFGSSIIFAAHPIQIGTIAFVHQQGALLSFLSVLLLLLSYLHYLRHNTSFSYLTVLCAFLLTLVVSGPALYPLLCMIALYWIERGKIPEIKEQAVFWGFWLLSFLLVILIHKGAGNIIFYVDKNITMLRLGIIEGIIKYLYPFSISVLRYWNLYSSHSMYYSGFIFPFVAAAITAVLFINRNRYPAVLIGWLLYMSMRLPMSNGSFPIDEYVFDGSLYASTSILSILTVSIVLMIENKIVTHKYRDILNYALIGITIFALTLLSHRNIGSWKNSETLWTQALHEDPENVFALNRRGSYYYSRYDAKDALKDFREAVLNEPMDVQSNMNLGLAQFMAWDLDSAIIHFKTILRIQPANAIAFYDLGAVYSEYNKLDSAILSYNNAIQCSPKFIEAYNGRAVAFGKLGNYASALVDYNIAIEMNPHFAEAWGNRALLFMQTGRPEKAILDFEMQCTLVPNRIDVRINTGLTAVLSGDTKLAKRNFFIASQIDSTGSRLYFNSASKLFLRTSAQRKTGKDCFEFPDDTVNTQ